jgi:hypothetical protein
MGARLAAAGPWEAILREAISSDAAEILIGQRLQKAIDVVAEDAALVELWACALSGFAQPIPPYGPDANYRLGGKQN